MKDKPDFIIIAGPNGAGKSTNGHLFVPEGLSIFNGDLELELLALRYPHIERERLYGGVASALENARDKALSQKAGFAFESNYSSDMASEISAIFREAGYKTTLVYFGLDSLKSSFARVQSRVNVGGHHVKPDVIQYNFQESIVRVNRDLALFDEVYFVDTRNHNIQIVAFLEKKSHKHLQVLENIPWYTNQFKQAVAKLDYARDIVTHIAARKSKGRRP